jgi:hypothetical protein
MSTVSVASVVTKKSITLNYNGETHMVLAGTPEYEEVLQALKDRDYDAIPALVEKSKRIKEYSRGNFTVVDGVLKVNGLTVPSRLADKILEFEREGLPFEGLVAFAKKLLNNPSYRSVNALFDFLETNSHPITDDGNFIAYKWVKKDFKDARTGTFDNSPGMTCEMPRNQVDEDPNVTCSHGLHVANWDYALNHYSQMVGGDGLMIEVSVNPADVVAVPIDYNNSKMRTCKYVVIGEVKNERKELFANLNPAPSNSNDDSKDDDGIWMQDVASRRDALRDSNDTDEDSDDEEDDDSDCEECDECGVDLDCGDEHEHWCSKYNSSY